MNFILLCGLPLERYELMEESTAEINGFPTHRSFSSNETVSWTNISPVSGSTEWTFGRFGFRTRKIISLSIPNAVQGGDYE